MQNYPESNKPVKFPHFTKQVFSSVHTKSFVKSMPSMNVVQRKKRTDLWHPDEKFQVPKHIKN